MNVIKYKTSSYEIEILLDDNGATEIRKDGENMEKIPADPAVIAAVIALALQQYGTDDGIHDEESDIITLGAHQTDWNGKARLMGRMPKTK